MTDDPGGPPVVAAVDCGSNSTRLLIASVEDDVVHARSRRTRITRLGAGVDENGRLRDDAIDRVVGTLDEYARDWRDAGVANVAVSATSAVRDAGNADRFVAAVREVTGTLPIVLSGRHEAELMFAGATAGAAGRHVVCDIGGGSTELVVGNGTVSQWASLQLGGVRLRERHLGHDPPAPDEYRALVADVDASLGGLSDEFRSRGDRLLAVAGTALTAAAVARRSRSADVDIFDGAVLTLAELAQVIEDLAWLPARRRLDHPPIVPGREDVIVAGALLLIVLARRFGFAEVEVRVADLLDGIALRAAAGSWPPEQFGSA